MAWGPPQLYLAAFSREHHNLFGLGFLEVNSSAYTLFDQVSNLVGQYLRDQLRAPPGSSIRPMIATEHPDLSGGIRFIDSARHRSYVDGRAFRLTGLGQGHQTHGWQPLKPGMFAKPLPPSSGATVRE